MIKINDYVYQLENEVIEYVKDQVYHESFTYYSDSEIKEFQENAVNGRICDLGEILDVNKVLRMNEKIKLEKADDGKVIKNIHDYYNNFLQLQMSEYAELENKVLKESLTEKEEDATLERMNFLMDEQKRITFKERKPLIEALKIARLGHREKSILENLESIEFYQGGKVASLSNGNDYGYTTFDIVVSGFDSQKVGNIVN